MRRLNVDVLVIGSGMGGMSAAALLATFGYRVFVAEKLSIIGGRCSTLEINGFQCTSGVAAIEINGVVEKLFQKTGADFEVIPAGASHYLIRGNPFRVPDRGGMKALLEAIGTDQLSLEKVMSAMSKAINWKEPSPGITLSHWIDQYSEQAIVKDIFQSMVRSALMTTIDDVPARYFFEFIKTLKRPIQFGYGKKGSGILPEALGRVVLRNDGEIWTDSAVIRILADKGVVQGAILQHRGREFCVNAQVVISNTGPGNTVALTGKQGFDPDYLQELETRLKPITVICLQIALDAPLFASNHLILTATERVYVVYQPTVSCPELAPEGKQLLVVNAFPGSTEGLPSEEGRQKEIACCFNELFTIFPALEKSATVLSSRVHRDLRPDMQFRAGSDLSVKTPIINLYNVGDGVISHGCSGLAAVVKSGMLVAEEVRQRMAIFGNIPRTVFN